MLKSKNNGTDFNTLETKMEHSLSSLRFINDLLNTKNRKALPLMEQERIIKLQDECLHLKLKLQEATKQQAEKESTINELQEETKRIQNKFDIAFQSWQDKLIRSQEEMDKITKDYTELHEQKSAVEAEWTQLQERYTKEVERKDQLELLLRENAQELKLTADAVLERDQKLDQYQQDVIQIQQMMDEKDELLETYVKEAQISSEELNGLYDKLHQLELENKELKEQLENQPPTDNEKLPVDQQAIKSKSRIPIPVNPATAPTGDIEMQRLKEDLFICNQKLMEKTSQNKELESAMERVTDHIELLRASLNESREESAARYTKMLDLMEENRQLKENKALH